MDHDRQAPCNYPNCDGGPATGYCHDDCRTSPPLQIVTCKACKGHGYHVVGIWVHEPGCGFGHDSTDEIRCENCLGLGEFVEDAEPDSKGR